MRSYLILLIALITSVSALWDFASAAAIRQHAQELYGQPIMEKIIPGIVKPEKEQNSQTYEPIVADVLPKTRGINIFARLTRDFEPISSRLNDASKNITVLAPRNSAIQALPRKPWENPEEYAEFGEVDAYQGQDGQDRAKRNLQRFVEAHLIPASPWKEDEEVETLGGEKLKWTKQGDKIVIQPGNIEVDTVAEQVVNGEVWVLNGVINYPSEQGWSHEL
ncbi:hypothetical protein N7474_004364 [Penicillium riverlandense]|uniref:uncharacterized protein n=1 Tax=Penicillium riverlandense TaxID=1903569 RepID=UPI0025475D41|nr:uncharacterized protein N7474_004364 [Penicillium riverlandense]KAJ5818773.1 hypothetical protein N7474_004364 [Penicillium riverlandense]